MKIKLTLGDTSFEFEKDPLPPERFKAVCGLLGGGMYVGMVVGVVRLCGILGLAGVVVGTFFVVGLLLA